MHQPLGSVTQDSDDVGVESEAVQKTHCFALHGSLGWDKNPERVFEGQHSRKGWMGGNHLLNTDSVLDCRLHGRLDNHQALPM